MERGLEKTIEEIMQSSGVKGVMFTDKHGLCLGVKGLGAKFSPGGVGCFANAAAKLDFEKQAPKLILLESTNRQCLIQHKGDITGAIYKTNPTPNTPNL